VPEKIKKKHPPNPTCPKNPNFSKKNGDFKDPPKKHSEAIQLQSLQTSLHIDSITFQTLLAAGGYV